MSQSRAERWGQPQREPDFSAENRRLRDLIHTLEVVTSEKPPLKAETIFQEGLRYRGSALEHYRFHTAALAVMQSSLSMGDMFGMNVALRWNEVTTGSSTGNANFHFQAKIVPKAIFEDYARRVTNEPLPPLANNEQITVITLYTYREDAEESYEVLALGRGELTTRPDKHTPVPTIYAEELAGLMELPEEIEKTLRKIMSRGLADGFEWPPEIILDTGERYPNPVNARGGYIPSVEMFEQQNDWIVRREVLIQTILHFLVALEAEQVDTQLIDDGLDDLYTLYPELIDMNDTWFFSSDEFDPEFMLKWAGYGLHRLGRKVHSVDERQDFDANMFAERNRLVGEITFLYRWLDVTAEELSQWRHELGL